MKTKQRKALILRWFFAAVVLSVVVTTAIATYSFWSKRDVPTHMRMARAGDAADDWVVPKLRDNGNRLLLLMIDGLSVPAYEAALAEGRMPNLQKLMRDRPTAAMEAISTFPSATSPSVQELLSGRYAEIDSLVAPGAVHAFDRQGRRIIRYVTEPDFWQWPLPTLFDALKGRPVVTVFEGRWDGPTTILTQYNIAGQAILEAIGASAFATGDFGPVQSFLDVVRGPNPPVLAFVVLNAFDMAGHFHGPDSSEAREALAHCDDLLGEIIATLSARHGNTGGSLLDETSIMIFGDHGMLKSGQFVDLPKFFTTLNINAVDASTLPHVMFRERLGVLWTEWPDTILVAGGSNVTQIYLRRPSGSWSEQDPPSQSESKTKFVTPSITALVAKISGLEGVRHVLWRDAIGSIHIADSASDARVFEKTDAGQKRFAYVVTGAAARDPLGYLADESTASLVCQDVDVGEHCFHESHIWSDRTAASQYPGAVPLLPKAFKPANFAGDLMVTARPGYSFLRGQQGDHGNLARDSMMTPLILNGPRIQAREERHAPRLVDIYPTASVLLGAAAHDPAFATLDGRVLDSVMEPAGGSSVE